MGGVALARGPGLLWKQLQWKDLYTSKSESGQARARVFCLSFSCLEIKMPKSFECCHCGKTFTKQSLLKRHVKSCEKPKKSRTCEGCDKTFRNQFDCRRHQASCMRPKETWVCQGCGKTFCSQLIHGRHQEACMKPKESWKCKDCGKTFRCQFRLRRHQESCGNPQFLCEGCGRTFQFESQCERHRASCINSTQAREQQHRCAICRTAFIRKDDLKKHTQSVSIIVNIPCICEEATI